MDNEIKRLVEEFFEIHNITEYEFREVCGFTFVFEREAVFINDKVSSAGIKPIGIIYEENGQYFLAPLDVIYEIEEVVKEFVKKTNPKII